MPTSHSQNPIPGILGDTPQIPKPFERELPKNENTRKAGEQKPPQRRKSPQYKRTQKK